MNHSTQTLGVVFGNRDFFPDIFVPEARADIVKLFGELGIDTVMLDPAETKLGGVESHADARKCAELFRRNNDRITSVLVCLPNFGDEKGVADTLKMAGLNVPVLVQGYPDDLGRLDVVRRCAAFCQCWTSLQKNHGCNACTSMSMMSEAMLPSACEVDVTGVLTMYAMQLASRSPSALVDWNNNYGADEDKCVLFHCGNWAKSFLPDIKVSNAPILGSTLGVENTSGALDGRTPASPLTYGRITTDDCAGVMRAYHRKQVSHAVHRRSDGGSLCVWPRCPTAPHSAQLLRGPLVWESIARSTKSRRYRLAKWSTVLPLIAPRCRSTTLVGRKPSAAH